MISSWCCVVNFFLLSFVLFFFFFLRVIDTLMNGELDLKKQEDVFASWPYAVPSGYCTLTLWPWTVVVLADASVC